jgi:hypothetical protein
MLTLMLFIPLGISAVLVALVLAPGWRHRGE